MTSWRIILSCGTDDDFLISLNFTRDLFFRILLPLFSEAREKYTRGSPYRNGHKTRGRQPQLESTDLLTMCLWYLKSTGRMYQLCPVFGVVQTTLSVWLDYALEVLLRVVSSKHNTPFEIRWPTCTEMQASASLIQNNRPLGALLTVVFAITDGARRPCAEYTDVDLQNAYFEGYTQCVEVTNLFVWNFYGELIHAAVNFPGS